ncbi:hypothetical protein Q4Q35_13530 [Flavivirga aquimarina]|uniref:Uncharacterized protein n=1 Tax=Flavivirga aquimarina TaxID=2027862 RepID=A0ABT8WCI3_9FLAO|nr:hypothetical protein [Flavivirga aquimarina]MDO5970830.1 hypothetical protein [Flavivirga aquimarina]
MDIKTTITITASILALLTSVFTSYFSWIKNKEIEKLRLKLESEKEKIKFLFQYETDKLSQYYVSLKDFLTLTQKIKDEIRFLINSNMFDKEKNTLLNNIQEKIINQYSKDIVFFKKSEPDIAHQIKNNVLSIIELLKRSNSESIEVKELLDKISSDQKSLRKQMDKEIDEMLKSIENNNYS